MIYCTVDGCTRESYLVYDDMCLEHFKETDELYNNSNYHVEKLSLSGAIIVLLAIYSFVVTYILLTHE